MTTSLPWDQVVLGCTTAVNLGSCLSCGCKHANVCSPGALVQMSGPPAVKHLACLKDSQPPLEILSVFCFFTVCLGRKSLSNQLGSNDPAVEMTFTQSQLILRKQKRLLFLLF